MNLNFETSASFVKAALVEYTNAETEYKNACISVNNSCETEREALKMASLELEEVRECMIQEYGILLDIVFSIHRLFESRINSIEEFMESGNNIPSITLRMSYNIQDVIERLLKAIKDVQVAVKIALDVDPNGNLSGFFKNDLVKMDDFYNEVVKARSKTLQIISENELVSRFDDSINITSGSIS